MADTTNLLGTIAGIPQSLALAEAEVDSLSELLSRDPEGYAEQDLEEVQASGYGKLAKRFGILSHGHAGSREAQLQLFHPDPGPDPTWH